ncbi:toxin glutamine deamidase domain-containing protein [Nonomuraea sp. B1E8]|uniref:WXG100-like domain-containing protein n=1 Tax=unclassified Nonomuraea TaxID=2593643 RepID=UPI00325E2A26
MEFPAWAEWAAGWLGGCEWPDVDLEAMRRLGDAWLRAADDIKALLPALDEALGQVRSHNKGDSSEAFSSRATELRESAARLEQLCRAMGTQFKDAATEIEYAQMMILATLAVVVMSIVRLVTALWAGGITAAAVAARLAQQRMRITLIYRQLLQAMLRYAAVDFATGAGLSMAVQGIQAFQGNRDRIDLGKAAMEGFQEAMESVVQSLTQGAMNRRGAPGETGIADAGRMLLLRSAGHSAFSGATGGAAAAAVMGFITGQPVSLEDMARAGVSQSVIGTATGIRELVTPFDAGPTPTAPSTGPSGSAGSAPGSFPGLPGAVGPASGPPPSPSGPPPSPSGTAEPPSGLPRVAGLAAAPVPGLPGLPGVAGPAAAPVSGAAGPAPAADPSLPPAAPPAATSDPAPVPSAGSEPVSSDPAPVPADSASVPVGADAATPSSAPAFPAPGLAGHEDRGPAPGAPAREPQGSSAFAAQPAPASASGPAAQASSPLDVGAPPPSPATTASAQTQGASSPATTGTPPAVHNTPAGPSSNSGGPGDVPLGGSGGRQVRRPQSFGGSPAAGATDGGQVRRSQDAGTSPAATSRPGGGSGSIDQVPTLESLARRLDGSQAEAAPASGPVSPARLGSRAGEAVPAPGPNAVDVEVVGGVVVDLGGLDAVPAERVREAVHDLARDYPAQFRTLEVVGVRDPAGHFPYDPNLLAYQDGAGGSSGLYLNASAINEHVRTSGPSLEEETGWTVPGGGSPGGIVHHEFGEHLAERILEDAAMRAELNRVVSQVLGRPYDIAGTHDQALVAAVEHGLSTYGANTPRDMIAEAFTEYRAMDRPRPLADAVGRFIDRHFSGESGAGPVVARSVDALAVAAPEMVHARRRSESGWGGAGGRDIKGLRRLDERLHEAQQDLRRNDSAEQRAARLVHKLERGRGPEQIAALADAVRPRSEWMRFLLDSAARRGASRGAGRGGSMSPAQPSAAGGHRPPAKPSAAGGHRRVVVPDEPSDWGETYESPAERNRWHALMDEANRLADAYDRSNDDEEVAEILESAARFAQAHNLAGADRRNWYKFKGAAEVDDWLAFKEHDDITTGIGFIGDVLLADFGLTMDQLLGVGGARGGAEKRGTPWADETPVPPHGGRPVFVDDTPTPPHGIRPVFADDTPTPPRGFPAVQPGNVRPPAGPAGNAPDNVIRPMDPRTPGQVPLMHLRPMGTEHLHHYEALRPDHAQDMRAGYEVVKHLLHRMGRRPSTMDDLRRILPHINPTNWQTNCPETSLAVDEVLSGRPAVAGPCVGAEHAQSERTFSARATERHMGLRSFWDIDALVRMAGPGARGIVVARPNGAPDATGHVYNVMNLNGEVIYIDAQLRHIGPTHSANTDFTLFHFFRTG